VLVACRHRVEIHQSSTNIRQRLFDGARSLHADIELIMKKGFLLSSSSSSSSKVVNERNKPSSVILPDDQSQSRKSRSNRVSNALLDLEKDTTNKGLSHLHPSSLLKVVRMQNNDNNDATDNDDNDDDDDCITVDNYEQDGGVQQQYNNDGAGLPNKGTAVDGAGFSNKFVYGLSRVDIQAQWRQERMSIRRQTTNNYSLAKQHQHQLRQRQQFRQEQNREQNREQHREARAEITPEQLENRREQDREQHCQARAEMTPEQLENRREQVREQHCQAHAAEGVQRTDEVNNRGETFSIDMIGRPTAAQLEGFEFDQDKALFLFYENLHDHVNDLIQELDDCEIGEGWRWQPLSKRCVCHGGQLACSTACTICEN
jgi:hypothetical protein